jgi:hypothetical protein
MIFKRLQHLVLHAQSRSRCQGLWRRHGALQETKVGGLLIISWLPTALRFLRYVTALKFVLPRGSYASREIRILIFDGNAGTVRVTET